VSYAIAAKRSGILLSVLSGAVFFKESIRDRLPYVMVMLLGMTLILLSGNAEPPQ
jgi:multidrug transporter EmrE-like cation transporter